MPSVSELPSLFTAMRHPRKRAVSVGPQSAADAYETMAYREKQRHESTSSGSLVSPVHESPGMFLNGSAQAEPLTGPIETPIAYSTMSAGSVPLPNSFDTKSKQTMHQGLAPRTVNGEIVGSTSHGNGDGERHEEREDREMFSKLERPRVRYDVEVVTKLIVYAGIALLAVEGNPILFEVVGLGIGKQGH